jgi:hypothetical protein
VSLVQSLTKSKAKKQPPQPKPKPTEMKQLLQLAVVRSRAGGRGPNSGRRLSEFVDISLDSSLLEARVIETAVQVLAPNEAKGLHNAAHHPEHGAVTYMQEVTEGGFSVFVGDPKKAGRAVLWGESCKLAVGALAWPNVETALLRRPVPGLRSSTRMDLGTPRECECGQH